MSDLTIIIGTKTYSSWSLRGWLAAKHTGLDCTEVKLPLDTPEFYERIEALSPTKRVPALHHGDIHVWDSLAIIDYCARIAPDRNWWPDDPAAYALARSMCAEMHSGFTELRTHVPMNLRGRWSGLAMSDGVAADVARIDILWQDARNRFGAGGDFLFGDFGGADMMYAPVVARLLTYDIAVSATARTYMDAIRAHPLVDAWYKDAATESQVVEQDEIAADATRLG